MVDEFWANHLTCAEVGRKLGCSRQNVHQRVKKGSIPSSVGPAGEVGVPIEWVKELLEARDLRGNESGSGHEDASE